MSREAKRPVIMHEVLYPRPDSKRFPAFAASDPLFVLKDGSSSSASAKLEYKSAPSMDTSADDGGGDFEKPQTTTQTNSIAKDNPKRVVSSGQRLAVPVQADGGEAVRSSNSLRDYLPSTVVLTASLSNLIHHLKQLSGAPSLAISEVIVAASDPKPSTPSILNIQRAVLSSIIDYTPMLQDAGLNPCMQSALECLTVYARVTQDHRRCFQVVMDLALHTWCLARGRFLVYNPRSDRPFRENYPESCQVFFRSDFSACKARDLFEADPERKGTQRFKIPPETRADIADGSFSLFGAAEELDVVAFIAHFVEFVEHWYPGMLHDTKPCDESKSCVHSQFRNLCVVDWQNGMRTLRKRQVPVVGIAQFVEDQVAQLVGQSGASRQSKSDTKGKGKGKAKTKTNAVATTPVIQWLSRGVPTVSKVEMLHTEIRGLTAATKTQSKLKAKKAKGRTVDPAASVLECCQPYAFTGFNMHPSRAVLDCACVRDADAVRETGKPTQQFVDDMLQLLETIGTRSDRVIANIRHQAHKFKFEAKDETKQKYHQWQVEPAVPEAKLAYAFKLGDSGCLVPRSPLPENMMDICRQPRDVLSPCNMSFAAFEWLLSQGKSIDAGDGQISLHKLKPGVKLISESDTKSAGWIGGGLFPGLRCDLHPFTRSIMDQAMTEDSELDANFTGTWSCFPQYQAFNARLRSIHQADARPLNLEVRALQLYRLYLCLCCLIQDEADVMATFNQLGGCEDNSVAHTLLQYGDHVHRAHLTHACVQARRAWPCLLRPGDSPYNKDWKQATTIFNSPGRGLLKVEDIKRLGGSIGLQVVDCDENIDLVLGILDQQQPDVPEDKVSHLVASAIIQRVCDKLREMLAVPVEDAGDGTLYHDDLVVSYKLPDCDTCGGHIVPSETIAYRKTMKEAVEHIGAFFRRFVFLPLLQYYAIATLPATQVLYTLPPDLARPGEITEVPWLRFVGLCKTSPLGRRLDGVSQVLYLAARGLVTSLNAQPNARSLVKAVRGAGRESLMRLVSVPQLDTLMALVYALDRDSVARNDPEFQADLAALRRDVQHAVLEEKLAHKQVQMATVVGSSSSDSDVQMSPAVKDSKEEETQVDTSGGGGIYTLADATAAQARAAQALLSRLQQPNLDLSMEFIEDLINHVSFDTGRVPVTMPEHPLDLLRPAFAWFFWHETNEARQRVVRGIFDRVLDASRNGSGSAYASSVLDSQTLAALRRLRSSLALASQPQHQTQQQPRATPVVAVAVPQATTPSQPTPVAATVAVVVPASPSPPPPPPVAAAVLAEPVRVVNHLAVNTLESPPSEATPPAVQTPTPTNTSTIIAFEEVDFGDSDTETTTTTNETPETATEATTTTTTTTTETKVAEPQTPTTQSQPQPKSRSRSRRRSRSPPKRRPPTQMERVYGANDRDKDTRRRSRSRSRSPEKPRGNGSSRNNASPVRQRSYESRQVRDMSRQQLQEHLQNGVRESRAYSPTRRKPLQFAPRFPAVSPLRLRRACSLSPRSRRPPSPSAPRERR